MKKCLCVIFCVICGFFAQADEKKFLSLSSGLNFVLNGIRSWNIISFEYGQNLVLKQDYVGFYTIGATLSDGWGYTGADLEYGYEFLRDKKISFGFNTFHSLGYTSAYPDRWGFGNAAGIFGNMKLRRSVSFLVQTGLRHNNPFKTIKKDLINRNFGPYIHLGICYSWL